MFMYLKNQTKLLSLQPPQSKNSTKLIPESSTISELQYYAMKDLGQREI